MFVMHNVICPSIIVFQDVTYQAHMQNEWTDQRAYFYSLSTIELVMRKGKKVPGASAIYDTYMPCFFFFFPRFEQVMNSANAHHFSLMSAIRLSVCGAGPGLTDPYLFDLPDKKKQTNPQNLASLGGGKY